MNDYLCDNRTFYTLIVACLHINFNSPYSVKEYKEKRGEVGMCYGGYGYGGGGYSGGGYGISSFALIVVLFILLVIVGASFYN